ncbi:MAG TPA: chaperonin GroEL [Planctomycetes bacterium]|nr:chaperonin GroEL [Planctomycetota bacterium]
MAQKELTFETEARDAVLKGVEKLANAVVSTLGPKGRAAILDKSWGGPQVTKDGVSVAREIELTDKAENLGAQLVKEAATKTSDRAGDGTTTATLLAWSIYRSALKHLTAGANPAALIRGIRKTTNAVIEQLAINASAVEGNEAIRAVATIASNNDSAIGDMLAEAFEEVGEEGVITVEEGKSLDTEVKVVTGMQFDRGFLSPNFATDFDTLECVHENPLILIHEEKIKSAQKLLPLLEKAKEAGRSLVVVAEDLEGEALATLVLNKMRGIVQVAAVKAPGYGDRRKEMLRDLATVTGAEPLMKDDGMELDNIELDSLGTAKKVLIDSNNTTIVEGAGNAKAVEGRAALIRRQIDETTSDYDKEKLQERLAKLVGGIAQIQVGGATETEVKEKKSRFEDARSATQAALEEGILPGGGTALLRTSKAVAETLSFEGEEAIGKEILMEALEAPVRTIAENAGQDGSLVARKVLAEDDFKHGWNALLDTYGDLVEMGIVDPTKVTRTALENAVSVACTLMTTDCLITELPEKDEPEEDHGEDF